MFVLCHGYQGNQWDMRLFRNHLAVLCPNAIFLISRANESDSNCDIRTMGQNLAREISDFMRSIQMPVAKVSFVCHSMGGLIMREALTHPLLAVILPKLHTFISLASQHVGYLYGRSSLTKSGLWAIQKWNKSKSLEQISLRDHKDPYRTYMYQLSKRKGLEFFSNIMLVSSIEDRYTPYFSARIEVPRDLGKRGPKWAKVYAEMADNLLKPVTTPAIQFTRFDVSFAEKSSGMSLDKMIGRTAHILFLDQNQYIMQLLHLYPEFFFV